MANNTPDVELPDMSEFTEEEQMKLISVMQRAKEFEAQERSLMRQPLVGILSKYTNVVKGWQNRWFSLDPDSGHLEYFEKEEHKTQRPRGSVFLAGAVISPSDEDSQTFTVNAANGEVYRLRAMDAKERQHWVNRLRATAEYHTNTIAQNAPPLPNDGRYQLSGYHKPDYLTGSQDSLNTTVTARSHHKTTIPPQRPNSLRNVKDSLNMVQAEASEVLCNIEDLPQNGEHINRLDRDLLILKATMGAAVACIDDCYNTLQQQQLAHSRFNSSVGQIEWNSPLALELKTDGGSSPAESYASAASFSDIGAGEVYKINHDDEVEDPAEYCDTDLGAVDEHKSIILHLLSQLKLGMDLTKVVLPTFILEKRSLLEMFADCMAHPETFLSIPDLASPEERILGVLEWYLTSFHAGRKGSVAKKPYNPIIGETFHCSWKVPKGSTGEEGAQTNGPSQEGDKDDISLYYTAEQVSHHPPVSAFYFESPEKNVRMNASIWTKSKFMGMSIGVQMVGKLCLQLLDLDEEYTFSLPSAYARSILTIPWTELGDRINITCAKTGYSAAVTFHTKPFYGGKLHKVSSEVKNNSGEIICKVAGEWNGLLEFTYANETTKVIDTGTLITKRKRVRPMSMQGDSESRKLWHKVTEALKSGEIDSATRHKRFLEERQRQGERHRKETNASFNTKYFTQSGDNWVYRELVQPSKPVVPAV